jgi:hypothetical protein
LYSAETWTTRKVDQKYLESCEIWCWRRTDELSWADRVKNEEVLQEVKAESNILHSIRRRNAKWISHVSRRNCLLELVVEGKTRKKT